MKKILIPGLLLCILTLSLTGCGAQPTVSPANAQQEGTTTDTAADAFKNSRPDRRAELNGTVKSIVGNEFTVETLDMSGMNLPDMANREKMEAMSDSERQAFFQQMQEATAKAPKVLSVVTIPVGIPIYITTRGAGRGAGRGFGGPRPGGQATAGGIGASLNTNQTPPGGANAVAAPKPGTIADIKEGYQVQIRLLTGSSDRAIAERVTVSASAGGGPNGGGGFGGGPGGAPGAGGGAPRP